MEQRIGIRGILTGKNRVAIYYLGVFFTLQIALIAYINSSFLESFLREETVGLVFTAGSLLSIFALLVATQAVSRFGNFRVALCVAFLNFFSLIGLILFKDPGAIILTFIIYSVASILMVFVTDIFLEVRTQDQEAGSVRGLYLTLMNVFWVISPVIAGFILARGNFQLLYFVSAVIFIPAIGIMIWKLVDFEDPPYKPLSPIRELIRVLKHSRLRNVFAAQGMLRLFYAWMVVYTPIYLIQHIGFSFDEMGLIFGIMLTAFVLVEFPAGWLADKKYGEKEFLFAGFIIIAVFTATLSFVTSVSIWVWALLLFATRIGAALIESMTEIYFFKITDGDDARDLSFFRILRPTAYIIAPLLASGFLILFNFQYIFILIGVVMLGGTYFAYKLKDTK